MARLIENYIPPILEDGFVSNKSFDMSGSTGTFKTPTGVGTYGGAASFSSTVAITGAVTLPSITEKVSAAGIAIKSAINQANTLTALNSTGTITAAILATGGITSTSGAAVTATIDSIANIATQFGTLSAGIIIPFYVQNPGSNTVTVAVPSGMVAAKQVSSGDTGVDILLTVAASATIGSAKFEIVFISATAAVLHRIY